MAQMSCVSSRKPPDRYSLFCRQGTHLAAGQQCRPVAVDPQTLDRYVDGAACLSRGTGVRRMATRRLGLIMHGVTGRMGMNQHLIRSILAIRQQGGVALSNGDRVMPDPILVGRNAEKVAELAKSYGVERSTGDLD